MKKKIMIVDDEPDIRYTIKDDLEDLYGAECEIFDADGGESCLGFLENDQIPDVILLDIMMLGMSGWELYDTIKDNSLWKRIPIVFLTARTDDVAKDAGILLGNDYIEKPFDAKDLRIRIDKALEKTSRKKGFFGRFHRNSAN